MNVQEIVLPEGRRLRVSPDLSPEARRRLKWMDYYLAHGRTARLTCRHFGLSPDTFYRWWHRFDPRRLESLEDDRRPRRPHRVRQPQTPPAIVERIRTLRETHPRWGKEKLAVLLRREGLRISPSTIGRILTRLKARGLLIEPRARRRSRAWHRRPHAQRVPQGYLIRAPGDLVQVDTLDVEVLPGLRRKQFTARDMVSRYDVTEVYSRATAATATAFLTRLLTRIPFPIRALQIDGGSEFRGAFEEACAQRHLPLFVIPPQSPKLQSYVERAHRMYREEFYQVAEIAPELEGHRRQLHDFTRLYNSVRPHQHLAYRTPIEYLQDYAQERGQVHAIY